MNARWWHRVAESRAPDFVIGGADRPYMHRWWLVPRNRIFNAYLHHVLRSDDDRALHDHPWPNISYVLEGFYVEHTIAAGGIHNRRIRGTGDIVFRRATAAHRLEIGDSCWSLFLTGPLIRPWGFHCPERGWVHWEDFVDPDDRGAVGPGCGS